MIVRLNDHPDTIVIPSEVERTKSPVHLPLEDPATVMKGCPWLQVYNSIIILSMLTHLKKAMLTI